MVPSLLAESETADTASPSSEAPDAPASASGGKTEQPAAPASSSPAPAPAQAEGTPGQTQPTDKPVDADDPDELAGLALPEGAVLAESDLTEIREFARAHSLDVKTARALLDRDNTRTAQLKESWQSELAEGWESQVATWRTAINADKTIGGDKLAESVKFAKLAAAEWSPEFRRLIVEHGYEYHPDFFRGLVSLGRRLAEPSAVVRGGDAAVPSGESLDPATAFNHPTDKLMPGMGSAGSLTE